MLSSKDARDDFVDYYSWSKAHTFIVPFAVPAPDLPNDNEIAAIKAEYDLPDQWFYCPNQFWEHKNHKVLIRALAIAVETIPNICLVCSGSIQDVRNPHYFDQLTELAKSLNVEENFRILGLIPYADVGILRQGSMALINPSKFEGWSTVVEEAKATGTKMILSDLAVHKEQCGDGAVYFGSDDPAALASALTEVAKSEPRSVSKPVKIDPEQNCRKFAEKFAAAIEAAMRGN